MMRKYLLLIVGMLAMMGFLIVGCDDDECPTSSASDNSGTLVVGNIILRPWIDFSADLTPVYGQGNEVDSASLSDSLCRIGKNYIFNLPGTEYKWTVTYFNPADFERFDSGDTAQIVFYVGNVPTTVDVKLINSVEDTTEYILPEPEMTVDPEQDFQIAWHRIEHADWYTVTAHFSTGLEEWATTTTYGFTTDTVYTFSGDMHPVDGEHFIYVRAVSGPVPHSNTYNVDGASLSGSIYSSSVDGGPVVITVGDGPAYPMAESDWPVDGELSADEALNAILMSRQ